MGVPGSYGLILRSVVSQGPQIALEHLKRRADRLVISSCSPDRSAKTPQRSLEKRPKCRLSASVGIGRPQEAVRSMMAEVNARQFPYKLIRVKSLPEVTAADRFLHQPSQEHTPFAFHPEEAVANRAFDIVELEESCGHGTPARQAGALRPAEPVLHEQLEAWQSIFRAHRRFYHSRRGDGSHVPEQGDLHLFFRIKVREEATLRHADALREHAERHAAQA
jgi:hypothetical protein